MRGKRFIERCALILFGCSMGLCQPGDLSAISGTVTDADGEPVACVMFEAMGAGGVFTGFSDSSGGYEILLAPGFYDLRTMHMGYESVVVEGVEVLPDQTTVQDITLQAVVPDAVISGHVSLDGQPLEGVAVE